MNARNWIVVSLTALVLGCASRAPACLRATADKRAIQWSDAIVHAKMAAIVSSNPSAEIYDFDVFDTVDGPLKPGQRIRAVHQSPAGSDSMCGGHLSKDDIGKQFLLLLHAGGDKNFVIVNIAPTDKPDAVSADAFKQLIEETRKAEASLTEDQIKAQAQACAQAQDDTEEDQAEQTLLEMGPKAIPMMRQVMGQSNDIGKERLAKLIQELTVPGQSPATQPTH